MIPKRVFLILSLLMLSSPITSQAAMMGSQNYSIEFGRVEANQVFFGDATSDNYYVTPDNDTLVEQNAAATTTDTNPVDSNNQYNGAGSFAPIKDVDSETDQSFNNSNTNASSSTSSAETTGNNWVSASLSRQTGQTGLAALIILVCVAIIFIISKNKKSGHYSRI